MPEIVVVSKPGCARCFLAKDKLSRMKLPFREGSIDELAAPPADASFPVLLIDGEQHTYTSAMARLKGAVHA